MTTANAAIACWCGGVAIAQTTPLDVYFHPNGSVSSHVATQVRYQCTDHPDHITLRARVVDATHAACGGAVGCGEH